MKEKICKCIANTLGNLSEYEVMKLIEIPPEDKMGDFALPCFSFSKVLRKNPTIIAKELKGAMQEVQGELGIEKLEAVNGYLNIFMNRTKYIQYLIDKMKEPEFGIVKNGSGKTICMDYSSPNIAKNFHVGHLRTTVIGNSLYRIYEKLGYKVVRINYLGDWGTQFGKLIVAYKKWSDEATVKEKGIEELLRIYVKFNTESEKNPELVDEARQWFVKMEQNNEEAIEIWKWFKEISLLEFTRVYELLGVSFDSYDGESFYRDKVPSLVEELKNKGLLKESQGANIIDLSDYDMPPCLITKSDGGSIYHSRDIAAILYRKENYGFDKCLYVTGVEQSLHFKQVFKAIDVMGYDWADTLIHVPYGLVSLEGEKLSSRNGNIIYAEDILNEAIERAYHLIEDKNPDLPDKEEAANKVGVGAIIFHDLFNQRIKNVDFSWEDVLSFDGTTGPYVQYTYARAKSIIKKNKDVVEYERIDCNVLTEDMGYALIKALSGYEEAIEKAAERYEPSVIARYLVSVATSFNRFYHECPILQAEEKTKQARLILVDLAQRMILDACSLLGMSCPEEM
ncbi:arginine--tRNA ligase [Clostridium sp. WB02_MRS01]|uniref:arginine--tRNA ligase n=1 Tax=Clostridium sp. WB02_MRS01 TaxID=2605777 RepID=UPI0012B3FADE|nr:arginine--tRNA ligase [Clostridium sp. WB02_MRS01]MSS08133.1 arginine--tRNA ligase [Clostridium sp. WB02_MRS01]